MYQIGTGEYLGNNAKYSASNLVCLELFKNAHVAISNKVLELKEDRGLFARIAANSRPDMHLQECLSNYELSIVPGSLFATDDTMLHCSANGKLKDILEKMSSAETSDVAPHVRLMIYRNQTNVLRYLILWLTFSKWTNLA